jgi:hypothetical protein
MNFLSLEYTYRTYLTGRGALTVDLEGNEVLVGLNRAESVEYAALTEGAMTDALARGVEDPERFLDLCDRHHKARPPALEFFYLKHLRHF